MAESNRSKSLHEVVEATLAKLVEPGFWEELGPDLSEKFKTAAYVVAHEASMHTLKEFERALDRFEKTN